MSSISSDLVMLCLPSWMPKDANRHSRGRSPKKGTRGLAAAGARTSLVFLPDDVLLEEVAERSVATGTRAAAAVVFHGLGFFLHLLRLYGQAQGAVLAVHAGEAGFHLVAFLEHRARILDAITRELGSTQVAFDAVAEVDGRALGVDRGDLAPHDAALRVIGQEVGEG